MRLCLLALLSAFVAAGPAPSRADEPVRVFAAASLTNALTEIGARWQADGHAQPSLAFGGSSILAKQVEAGAPADVFASADTAWMDYLAERGRIDKSSRVDLLGNELVLIAPKGRGFAVTMQRGFHLAKAFSGKLCTGEPGVVPVGIYAREALESLEWWESLQGRIVGTEDVRTALTFVERGECAAGIVYATDAGISNTVEVVARFPADSHKPIVYPFALVTGSRPEGKEFLGYLRNAQTAVEVFQRYGFVLLEPRK